MKLHRYLRKSAGATLGLMAAVIFIVFAIGLFLCYTGSVIGGNHELNRASDAGILNAAKQALVQPAIALNDPSLPGYNTLPYNDFAYYIADQNINGYPAIDLITYNRCAAQAVLVGLEAEKIGTEEARQNAQQVALAVLGIGKTLQANFQNGYLNNYYDTTANENTLNMLGGGSTVNRQDSITQAYVDPGRPSNIFFYWDVTNPWNANCLSEITQNQGASDPKPNEAQARANNGVANARGEIVYYAAGYTPITVMPGTAEASTICFVPVNPQSTPHAIDQGRVNNGLNPPGIANAFGANLYWVPPNAFKAYAQANVNFSATGKGQVDNNVVRAISCAMVGCGAAALLGGGVQDQAARIPGGYVRVRNWTGMDSGHALPFGPLPTAQGVAIDGHQFILNNAANGIGNRTVYIGTPIPMNGANVDVSKVIFAYSPNSKIMFGDWIKFNNSRLPATDPNYNADVINGQHRDPNLDKFNSPNSSQILNAGKDPIASQLYEGPNPGQHAILSDLVNITGYVEVFANQIDGVTPLTDSNGNSIPNTIALEAVVGAAGYNLNQTPPVQVNIPVPPNHQGWTWLEYTKYSLCTGFWSDYIYGHFTLNSASAPYSLVTGLKNLKWFHDGTTTDDPTTRFRYASPNDYLLLTKGSDQGLEIPSSCQIMYIDNPNNLLLEIDDIINHRGGYQNGQITYDQMVGSIANQVRLINPKWNVGDVKSALSTANLPMGALMYLRDDGKGNLIMTNTCPQDPNPNQMPEGYIQDWTGYNQLVPFQTQPGQYMELNTFEVDTQMDGSLTAYKGDANVEFCPWRGPTEGTIPFDAGAILYKGSGHNNLLGEVQFYCQPGTADTSINVNWIHPN